MIVLWFFVFTNICSFVLGMTGVDVAENSAKDGTDTLDSQFCWLVGTSRIRITWKSLQKMVRQEDPCLFDGSPCCTAMSLLLHSSKIRRRPEGLEAETDKGRHHFELACWCQQGVHTAVQIFHIRASTHSIFMDRDTCD